MKIYKKIFILTSIIGLSSNSYATGEGCPKGFGVKGTDFCETVRIGTSKKFTDSMKNINNYPIKIKDLKADFQAENNYDYSTEGEPIFKASDWINNKKGVINAGEEGIVIDTEEIYYFRTKPETRSYNNLKIVYDIKFKRFIGGIESGSLESHKEKTHIELSWCGDGVIDKNYGEACDFNDLNKIGFGNKGCSKSCQTINIGEICGDGIRNSNEQCDPADEKHSGWGNKGCSETCDALDGPICDQTFNNKLRHGRSYTFWDIFSNNSSKNIKFKKFRVKFNEKGDPNGSTSVPIFKWTNWITDKGWIMNSGESGKNINSTNNSKYSISYYPDRPRDNAYDDVNLIYINYYTNLIDGQERGYHIHSECDNYEITWCGDGTRDNYTENNGTKIKELCDPKDKSHKGWGKGGCSNKCKPIAKNETTCKIIKVSKPLKIGIGSSKKVSCVVTNAKKIKIDCGNGLSKTFTGNHNSKQTITETCIYKTAGTYTPKCIVNDLITNMYCQSKIEVYSNKASIDIVQTDHNTNDLDGSMRNNQQTINSGNDAIFRVTIQNNGSEDLTDIYIESDLANSCEGSLVLPKIHPGGFKSFQIYGLGNHLDNILQIGEKITYICSKSNVKKKAINKIMVFAKSSISNKKVKGMDKTYINIK